MSDPNEKEGKDLKVKFLRMWSSDRGCFLPGKTEELPASIAKSLIKEGVAEKAEKA